MSTELSGNKLTRLGNFDFYKSCIKIAAPVMLQQLIMGLVSLVDNFMVAGLGDAKMAAVNVSNQVNFFYLVLIMTFYGAGGIYMAQNKGAKNILGMQQAFRFKMLFPILISTFYMASILIFPEFFIKIMTHGNAAQGEIVTSSAKYMRVVSFSCIPIAISGAIGTSYRETGKPKIPLIISVIATGVNTFLNYILIYGNFGAPRLEEIGAGVATVIARIVEMTLFITYIKLRPEEFYVRTREIFKIRIKVFLDMLRKSSMMFVGEITWGLSEMFMTSLYNSRGGSETVAGMAGGFTIANIFYLVFQGVHVATAVIVGGTLGRGDITSARQKARWIMYGSIIAGGFVGIVQASSTLFIPIVFSNLTLDAKNITRGLVILIACYMPIWTYLNAQFAISRSGGDTLFGVIVDVPVTLLLFVPGAIILTKYTSIGPVALFGIVKTTDFVKAAIGKILLKKEKWVKNITDLS